MRYPMNCQFEAPMAAGATRDQVEDAVSPMLDLPGEDLGDGENINRSSDIWFDGKVIVACVNAFVGYDFPDAFHATCSALGRLASQPFKPSLSDEDGNGPEAASAELTYGLPATPPAP